MDRLNRRAFLAALTLAPLVAQSAPATAPDALAARVARRYRIAPVAAALVVDTARAVYPEDPALLVALAGVESTMQPFAIGQRGEIGLTQVRAEMHGVDPTTLIDPRASLAVCARILREGVKRAGGNVTRGLTAYNGRGPAAEAYAARVFVERGRLTSLLPRDERKRRVQT